MTNEKINDYIEQFSNICFKYDNLITCGDINIDLLSTDLKTQVFMSTVSIHNQLILNKTSAEMATRVKNTKNGETKTIIDIITTNIIQRFSNIKFYLGENNLSDHKFIALSLQSQARSQVSFNKPQLTPNKLLTIYNWPNISSKLIEVADQSLNFDSFHKSLCKHIDQSTALKKQLI